MIRFLLALLLLVPAAHAACTKINMPTDFSTVASGTRANLKANFTETQTRTNTCIDSLDEIRARFTGYTGSLFATSLENLRLRLDGDATATAKFVLEGSSGDTLFRVSEDSTAKFFGALTGTSLTLSGTATVTGVTTFTAAPVMSALTASLPVFTDGSKALASNAMTGTGSVVMSASPTLTGTAAFANTTASGTALTTGVHTFTAAPVFSSATASLPMFTDGSKALVSNAMTGTGSVMMSASPTTTGTLTAAAANFSGAVSTGALSATTGTLSSTLDVTGSSRLRSTLGLVGAAGSDVIIYLSGASPVSSADQTGIYSEPTFSSAATSSGMAFSAALRTAAASYTMTAGHGMRIFAPVIGAGSTVTTLYGLKVEDQTAGGTNYAIYTGAGLVRFGGAVTHASTMTQTGVATFTVAPIFSSVTASQFLLVDGSNALTSVAGTGSGSVVRATSPTITTPTFSGTIASGLTASRTVVTDGSGNFAVNTETGTGDHVRATSPTLVTPALGVATATTIALGGNEAFTYDEGTFTCTLTGFTTTVNGTCRYTRMGTSVSLFIPAMTGTSNATTMNLTGLPASISPARNKLVLGTQAQDNTSSFFPVAFFYDTGVANQFAVDVKATIGGTYNFNGWTSSGTKGIDIGQDIHYNLN